MSEPREQKIIPQAGGEHRGPRQERKEISVPLGYVMRVVRAFI